MTTAHKNLKKITRYIGAIWFNATFYGTNIIMCIGLIWTLVLPRKKIVRAVNLWLGSVAWIERHLGGISFEVVGRERLPDAPFIVACKHQSEWETFKLHLFFDDPAVVLKKELLNIPLIGWYMRRSGAIPVDRSAGAKAILDMTIAAKHAAAEGRPIVIFPEGTRVGVGESRPYKSGVAALYQELGVPVVPVALNSGLLWPKSSFFKKRGHVTVEILPPIPAGLARDDMMRRLRDEMEAATARLVSTRQNG